MKIIKKAVSVMTALGLLTGILPLTSSISTVSAVTVPEGYAVAEQVTLDFNTDNKGWSGTNGTLGTNLKQVASDTNASDKHIVLHTPNGNGYNVELANGSTSTTAYTMSANTKYSVSFKVKVIEYSGNGSIQLNFGSKAAYDPNVAKVGRKSWTGTSMNDGEWHECTYEWTTTSTMAANTYDTSLSKTNICDKLYFVANNGMGTFAIDDVVITKYVPSVPDKTVTLTFNNQGKGYSDCADNYDKGGTFAQSFDGDNGYITLGTPNGNGYNIEMADGDSSTTAFKTLPNTKYTVTVIFKTVRAGSGGQISLNLGTQSLYSGSLAKVGIKSWTLSNYDDGKWHTESFEFTTTSTMAANTYNTSLTKTNICDRIYFVANGGGQTGCEFQIDEVIIKQHGTDTSSGGTEGETLKVYTISDFTHEPYKTHAAKGQGIGQWYCSIRWFIDTDGNNSVMRYQYAYDIAENAPSTSGIRGVSAKGTNGSGHAMCSLVYKDNTPITLTSGKSYRISFKYKVLSVENNSYLSFVPMRGKCQSGWATSYGVGAVTDANNSSYVIDIAYAPTEDWVEASYTFTADYSTNTDYNVLQLGGAGYGDALIDNIKVEEIDKSEVLPPNNDASVYGITVSNGNVTINSYKLKESDITVKSTIAKGRLVAIGDYAFLYNRYVKNIKIENGPTTIGNYAFEYARVLETVELPASIKSIGKGAFYGAPNLKAINVSSANSAYKSVDGVLYTADMKTLIAYPAAKAETEFTVPSTVTEISEGAFLGAANLKAITLPNGLTKIGRRAFMNCTSLETLSLPESISEIGASAFRGCSKLSSEKFELSERVSVAENAFVGCDTLYKVGDIENNGTVDIRDAGNLVKYLASTDEKLNMFENLAADINGDGNVDLLDAVILKRHLAEWNGYDALPCDGKTLDKTYTEYTTDSTSPELVVNLSELNTRKVDVKRDIEYDPNKEDVIIILVTGQSNSGANGYQQEYEYKYTTIHGNKAHPEWEITAEPDRPTEGTVFSGASVTVLDNTTDVYFKADPSRNAACMGGYTPAMGKALNEATGAKIVFVQANQGAVGMHEWTPNPEDYTCPCPENGHGVLYSNAIANFTKTYQTLNEDYNIIATAYVYNQGEHEEGGYALEGTSTIHSDETYYNALVSMHNGFLSDCEIDCGGMYMPRSYFPRYPNTSDTEENSRRPSYARTAMYSAAQRTDNFYIFSNITETICRNGELKPDPSNSIHYSQKAYNAIGRQNADSMLKYFGFEAASAFTGIKVFNNVGKELCAFDTNGKLISGSDNISFTADNLKLYIRIDPTGTMYTLNYSCAGTDKDFVDDFCVLSKVDGSDSFKIVINTPKN